MIPESFKVSLELPSALARDVLAAAWWDGARTAAVPCVLLGLLVGYLLWGRK